MQIYYILHQVSSERRYYFQLNNQVQCTSFNMLSSKRTHFGKDFASKADMLQQGAARPHHSMIERRKKVEKEIWTMVKMHFWISYTE